MKTFFFTLVLFSLLIGLIIYNYFAVNAISSDLIERVVSLPSVEDPNCITSTQTLSREWKANRDFVSFSCALSKLDAITDLTERLCFYAEVEARDEFELTRRLLINALEDVAEFESLSPQDVF